MKVDLFALVVGIWTLDLLLLRQNVNITYIPFHVEYVSYILFFAETLFIFQNHRLEGKFFHLCI